MKDEDVEKLRTLMATLTVCDDVCYMNYLALRAVKILDAATPSVSPPPQPEPAPAAGWSKLFASPPPLNPVTEEDVIGVLKRIKDLAIRAGLYDVAVNIRDCIRAKATPKAAATDDNDPQPEPAPGPYSATCNPETATWDIKDADGCLIAIVDPRGDGMDESLLPKIVATAKLMASVWSKDKENKAARELMTDIRRILKNRQGSDVGSDLLIPDIDAHLAEYPA